MISALNDFGTSVNNFLHASPFHTLEERVTLLFLSLVPGMVWEQG